jgi:outer membrane protein assembly factor BamB
VTSMPRRRLNLQQTLILACALPVLEFSAAAAAAEAGDWPRFRGPTGDGVVAAGGLPLTWSATQNIAWAAAIPGRGYSSPVILGDRIWLTTAMETNMRASRLGPDPVQQAEHVGLGAVCVERKTGRVRWHTDIFQVDQPEPVHELNSYATPTPAVEPGRLYCDFGTYGTACLDAESGAVIWKKRLPLDHHLGPGSSIALHKDHVFLVRDGRDQQYVAALDKRTGETAWKTDRPLVDAPEPSQKKCFSSPLLIDVGGRAQAVVVGPHWVVSYDPETGKEIWRLRHGKGFSNGSCPVYGHGGLFFGTGCFKPEMCAVRVDGQGDVTDTHLAWRSDRQVPVMSSPVLAGDDLWWVSDGGVVSCSDAKTGEMKWKKSLGRPVLASPLLANGRLYFFDTKGRTTVLGAADPHEVLAENELEAHVVASPAAVDGALYLRVEDRLYCIRDGK